MQKTLGGDRLGSGNKNKIHLHGYERSTHDLGYVWRSTMAPGTLVPFLKELALPGDTFDIDLQAYVNTHPTIGPLFGSFKMQLDVFQAPIRLYQGQLHNNKLGIGLKMANVKLPLLSQVSTETPTPLVWQNPLYDVDNSQINPSCILSYLGIRGIGFHPIAEPEVIRPFNGVPLLAYWDIYKQYYSNKQEEIGAVIHSPMPVITFVVTLVTMVTSGSSAPVPQIPTTANLSVNNDTYVTVTYTGTFQPEYFQFYKINGYSTAAQTFSVIEDVSTGVVRFRVPNWAAFGNTNFILAWDYIDPLTVPHDGEPQVTTFPLENIDNMRELILAHTTPANATVPFNINNADIEPYKLVLAREGTPGAYYYSRLANQEGLAIKTYQSDIYNNWLSTEWIDGIDGINEITAIDTSGGNFTIDTLILAKKVYNMLNRIAVSGGTYDDWLDVTYDHPRFTRAESPIYHGGLIKEIVFEEVIAQASSQVSSTSEGEPLGTLAGKGTLSGKHKGGHLTIKVDEPSYIMGIVSITPRIDYSQGNKWDVNLMTMDDFHKPGLDEIGFQELMQEQMAWWADWYDAAGVHNTFSAGKTPAWINYMTNVNEIRGNFAAKNDQMFMVLTRRYQFGVTATSNITDLTTYIDPAKYNYIFAQTSRDAQNFWVQLGINMKVRRKISAKVMPNI